MSEKEQTSATTPRVALLTVPWAEPSAPSLALGTIKSIVERDGIPADVYNLHLTLIQEVGLKRYQQITAVGDGTFRGEIFFSPHYFDTDVATYAREVVRPHYEKNRKEIEAMLGEDSEETADDFINSCEDLVLHGVDRYFERCDQQIDWDRYDVIGFSLMFDQTLAALSLARRIKQRFPEKKVVFGGPNCDGEMGYEMLRSFPEIDAVAVGEADRIVSQLFRSLHEGKPLDDINGIGFRRDGEVIRTEALPLMRDLDWLPQPEYSAYFEHFKELDEEGFEPWVFFESSRGCWWGQKMLCTFCGLNANGLQFRRKTPERVVEEILSLEKTYGISTLIATDNILDMSYFNYVLPELKKINETREMEDRIKIFYETKSNLKKDQLILMLQAGIRKVQPGIESFSDGILKRMRKGSTGIQQMQFVKWATELGMAVAYGMLYANPGDDPQDYRDMEKQVDFLDHLEPPEYLTPIALDRFSPYWYESEQHGISGIKASNHYRMLFPDENIDLSKLVYRFEFEHADQENEELQAAMKSCIERFEKWQKNYTPNSLLYDVQDDVVFIRDRRYGKSNLVKLKGLQGQVFLFLDQFRSLGTIAKNFTAIPKPLLEKFLDKLIAMKWVYRDSKGRYLAMPIHRVLSFKEESKTQEEGLAKAS